MGARSRGGWPMGLLAVLVLLVLSCCALPASAAYAHGDADSESEESVTAGLDQSILDSAAQEIQAQLDLESELNERSQGESRKIVDANSPEAASLDLEQHPRSEPTEATSLSFLSELEEPVNELNGVDVESHLDTIATELDSLFKTDAEVAAEAEEKAEAEARSHTRAGRARAKRARAHALQRERDQARHQAAAAQKKADAAPAPVAQKASKRQQKLVARLDGYRTARGHADVSTLEATAHARTSVQNGYSMPSAFVPANAGGIPPAPAAAAFQGQVGFNPMLSQGWLGVPQAAAPVVAAPAANIAGVGALLQALKGLQEQQETTALLGRLAALLRPAAPVAVQQPSVIQSPFNYGQQLVATPAGWANPNLAPANQLLLQPRVMPGAVPGWSPSYPSMIPNEGANVGVEAEQPNPFEAHSP